MFGLFKRKPKPPTYKVWINDPARWSGIWSSIEGRAADQRLLLIYHFDETAELVKSLLGQEGHGCESLDAPQRPEALAALPAGLYLIRSDHLDADEDAPAVECSRPLKLIAVEPHYLPDPDIEVCHYAGSFAGEASYEHHVSLDDPVMTLFAGQRTLDLLKKTGFTEAEPLVSPMVSSALHKAQQKVQQMFKGFGLSPQMHSSHSFMQAYEKVQQRKD